MFGKETIEKTNVIIKTYHIGECCQYGTVKVWWKGLNISVQFMDYKTDKVRDGESFHFVDKSKVMFYLEDFMSHYYADKIMKDFYA